MNLKATLEMCEFEKCEQVPHAYLFLKKGNVGVGTDEFFSQKRGYVILKGLATSADFNLLGGTKRMVVQLEIAIKNSVLPAEPEEPPEEMLRAHAVRLLGGSPEAQEQEIKEGYEQAHYPETTMAKLRDYLAEAKVIQAKVRRELAALVTKLGGSEKRKEIICIIDQEAAKLTEGMS